ncbi:uncharacterized protein PG986_014204 [Apiospora aurea]|uniref:Uncharacterized protein n=1 Tax=Apiospora aurea TaxID=335848 RepID=A0ABR1PSB8_9PEZI
MSMQPQQQQYDAPPYPRWVRPARRPDYHQAPGSPCGQIPTNGRPAAAPPPSPATMMMMNGAPQQNYTQAPGFVPPPPQRLLFTAQGKDYIISDPSCSKVLFAVVRASSRSWLSSSSPPHMSVRRGDASGPELATVHYHSFTTSKMDVTLHLGGAGSSSTQRYKKDFDSTTGLGHLRWQNESSSFFSCSSRGKGGLKLEASAGGILGHDDRQV